ncbi:MAG: ABC transporter ATP-binding protein [Chloroflexales bacterium]|nr:ABC transporter ATP-binding protein [Chloroflexales bacterium]
MSAIIVERVSKQFPGEQRPAVDECSFSAAEGEFIVLLGPSGCGKTTLLKMINRLYEPSGGRILMGGSDIQELPVTELRRRIGYVIQQTGLFPHMRIADNIAVVPRLLRWDKARIEARIDELLELVGLPVTYRKRFPRQLSGGEQQRVGIARALAADPAIILMDEPFSAIDAITRARLQDELLMIQRRLKKTILFVTHDVEEALRLADRIIVMREGRIVQFDTPLAILSHPADEQVQQLVGAGDQLRRLSLVPVSSACIPNEIAPSDAARIDATDDLRSALSLLLASGAASLAVTRDGAVIGSLGFEQIRSASRTAEQVA